MGAPEKPEPKGVKDTHPMETAIVEKQEHAKKPPLGSGQRFKNLTGQLARKGVQDPAALAAYIVWTMRARSAARPRVTP